MSTREDEQTIILRPPVEADAQAVLEVLLARDIADLGGPDFTLADLLDDWGRTEFDLASDAVVCETAAGEIVAYAGLRRIAGDVYVSPEREGEGLGKRLSAWVLEQERRRGRPHHRQAVPHANRRAAELLQRHGYAYLLSSSRMARIFDGPAEPARVPDGVRLRPVRRDEDAEALYALDDIAFASSPDFTPMSFTAFCEEHLHQNDHAPEFSLVAELDGQPAAFLLASRWEDDDAAHVDILAVDPAHQGRGIGTALLGTALERFAAAGLREAHLGVSSTNPGARGLYERAGMTERFRIDIYQRPIDMDGPGHTTGPGPDPRSI